MIKHYESMGPDRDQTKDPSAFRLASDCTMGTSTPLEVNSKI